MFKLYDMKKVELLVSNEDEEIIYKTVCNRFKQDTNQRLLINKRVNGGDCCYFGIRSEEDFENYKKYYEFNKLKNKSCIELKKEILDLSEKNKVKTLENYK